MLGLLFACVAPPDAAPPVGRWVPCEVPAQRVTYEDVGPAWGLLDTTDPTLTVPDAGNPVALADLDGDGLDDLLVARRGDALWAQPNLGGALDLLPVLDDPAVDTLTLGDVDADGDPDLLVAAAGLRRLRNDGGFAFTDISAEAGLAGLVLPGQKRQPVFADPDADGDLDLFVPQVGPPGYEDRTFLSYLLRNDDGVFVDARGLLGDAALGSVYWSGFFTDHDRDGDADLVLPADVPNVDGPSYFFRNQGGAFVDDSLATGVRGFVPNMGGSVGDYDGDGAFDLFLTATGPNGLYRNLDGLYVDVTRVTGTAAYPDLTTMSLGSAFVDHDNDGWLDLFIVGGRQGANEEVLAGQAEVQPDLLLQNQGGTFVDVTAAVGVDDPNDGRGVAVGDIDADGFADLLVGGLGEASRLWRARCTGARSVNVRLEGEASNREGIGATVELVLPDRVLVQEVTANQGFAATSAARARFGVGDAAPERLVVRWPSGTVQEVAAEALGTWVTVREADAR